MSSPPTPFTERAARRPLMPRDLLLARVISTICLPPLLAVGTLGILSWHATSDAERAGLVGAVSSFFVAIAPCAYVAFLLSQKQINGGMGLVLKEERIRPYLFGAGSCTLGLLVLARLSAPRSVTLLAACYAASNLAMAAVTRRWKISAHAAGAAAPVAALLSVFGTAALPLSVIVPAVCWARVHSQAHTVAQVCAGALLGFLFTWLGLAVALPGLR